MKRAGALAALALLFTVLLALGWWQVERRAWKLALIERVERRVHAAAVELPSRPGDDEYRRVHATGRYVYAKQVFAQAVTAQGPGFWVLTPLQRTDGSLVLVNRGFAPAGALEAVRSGPDREVQLTGLLRLSEAGGGFLRRNDPAAQRWYSRDVAAIAQAQGLPRLLPGVFIDADAGPDPAAFPVGGLTVIRFSNSHLGYALTWFALAALVAWAGWKVWRVRQDVAHDDDHDDDA